MPRFIEVRELHSDRSYLLNVDHIMKVWTVIDAVGRVITRITMRESYSFEVEESYLEIKEEIENATQ